MIRRLTALLGAGLLTCAVSARAQTPPGAPQPAPRPAPKLFVHRFWDSTNVTLFAGVAAARALDYDSTRHFRARGVNEWLLTNGIVDNKPLFIGIETATTAASIGVAYWLHRRGNHRLERWVSAIHIGVGVGGSVRNYTLRGPASSTSP